MLFLCQLLLAFQGTEVIFQLRSLSLLFLVPLAAALAPACAFPPTALAAAAPI